MAREKVVADAATAVAEDLREIPVADPVSS